jgi:hypothetical protein
VRTVQTTGADPAELKRSARIADTEDRDGTRSTLITSQLSQDY